MENGRSQQPPNRGIFAKVDEWNSYGTNSSMDETATIIIGKLIDVAGNRYIHTRPLPFTLSGQFYLRVKKKWKARLIGSGPRIASFGQFDPCLPFRPTKLNAGFSVCVSCFKRWRISMNNSIELNFENFYVELIFDWFRDTVFKSTIEKFWYFSIL